MEKLVKPLDTARAITFECTDSYTTSPFREELAGDDVLLTYRLNGQEPEEGDGFPLGLWYQKIRLQKCIMGGTHSVYPRERARFLGETRLQRQRWRLERRSFQQLRKAFFN